MATSERPVEVDEASSPNVAGREGEDVFVDGLEDVRFQSYVRTMQRIVLFETKTRLYIVGSNEQENRFRILKLDRCDPRRLVLLPEARAGSVREIKAILATIEGANSGINSVGDSGGVGGQKGINKVLSAYGIAGFIRFLEGYYVIFIVRRLKCAMIGFHSVYKIEETKTVYIPNPDCKQSHTDESRYSKMFASMDLTTNFYYSYSYDLTNTLQHNLATPKLALGKDGKWHKISDLYSKGEFPSELSYIGQPNERFTWNSHLLEPVLKRRRPEEADEDISHEWILPVIHGYVQQNNLSVFGKAVFVTLVGRRSSRYAGTRFLKRGANEQGDVANEVETEQIVFDSSVSWLQCGGSTSGNTSGPARATSFVQIRGSVPGLWGQEMNNMMPKPQIFVKSKDLYCIVAGQHFNRLHEKYGTPVHVINLVKRKEKHRRRHEVILAEMLEYQIRNLNFYLYDDHRIKYSRLDMARAKKHRGKGVMHDLTAIAEASIRSTGLFCNFVPELDPVRADSPKQALAQSLQDRAAKHQPLFGKVLQTGVARTNCVDCLDRTNIAQFVIAKSALALQLYALGVISEPVLDDQSDCVRMLERMFDDHGNTISQQYGGSNVVHTIQSYRGNSLALSSKAQNIRRYYSNTLSDSEKQNIINLFLGIYRVLRYPGDKWWNPRAMECLPFSLAEREKKVLRIVRSPPGADVRALFKEQYRTFEYAPIREAFEFKEVLHSVRDIAPYNCLQFSPFAHREERPKFHETVNAMSSGLLSRLTSYIGFGSGKRGAAAQQAGSSSMALSSASKAAAAARRKSRKKNGDSDDSEDESPDDSDDDDGDDDGAMDDWTLMEADPAMKGSTRGGGIHHHPAGADIVLGVEALPAAGDGDAEGAVDILVPEDGIEVDSDVEEALYATVSLSDADREVRLDSLDGGGDVVETGMLGSEVDVTDSLASDVLSSHVVNGFLGVGAPGRFVDVHVGNFSFKTQDPYPESESLLERFYPTLSDLETKMMIWRF